MFIFIDSIEVIPTCSNTKTSSTITSPQYPQKLPRYTALDCMWTLIAQPGYEIRLEFLNFELSNPSQWDRKCVTDYLEIYDGISNFYENSNKICGDDIPNTMISNAGAFFLKFHSGTKNSDKKGFEIKYDSIMRGILFILLLNLNLKYIQ